MSGISDQGSDAHFQVEPITAAESHRFATTDSSCPICGGFDGLPRGAGVRCWGAKIGALILCTREEFAGAIAFDSVSPLKGFRHRAHGPCACGKVDHLASAAPPIVMDPKDWASWTHRRVRRHLVETYPYQDAAGNPVFMIKR